MPKQQRVSEMPIQPAIPETSHQPDIRKTPKQPAIPAETSKQPSIPETPKQCLKLTKKIMKQAQEKIIDPRSMPPKFNDGQCTYLADKLRAAVDTADKFLEVFNGEYETSFTQENKDEFLEIFKLLSAYATEADSFIRECCKDAWIPSAVRLTNASEHVSTIAFNLELCAIVFSGSRKRGASESSLSVTELVDKVNKEEVGAVQKKASLDMDALLRKLKDEVDSLLEKLRARVVKSSATSLIEDNRNYQLGSRLLKRLKPIRAVQFQLGSIPEECLEEVCREEDSNLTERGILDTGGFGIVHEADWHGAVKVAEKKVAGTIKKEVSILGRMSHSNIATLLCYTQDIQFGSIVTKLMDKDLLKLIEDRVEYESKKEKTRLESDCAFPFTLLVAVDIMLQFAGGMCYMHEKKIAHRDLKSKNILVRHVAKSEYVLVEITDFGESEVTERNMTDMNPKSGTLRWKAPELLEPPCALGSKALFDMRCAFYLLFSLTRGENMSSHEAMLKCDVHSFAMVCYEILSGKLPFGEIPSESRRKIEKLILNGPRPTLPHRCPTRLKSLIERCWNSDPSRRPSFGSICAELRYQKYELLMTCAWGKLSTLAASKIGSLFSIISDRRNASWSLIEKTSEDYARNIQRRIELKIVPYSYSSRPRYSWSSLLDSFSATSPPSPLPSSSWYHSARIEREEKKEERKEEKKEECKAEKTEECKEEKKEEFCTPPSSSWYHSARIECEEVKTEECKEEKKEEFCTPPSSSWYHSARIECEEVKTEECKEEKKDEFCTPPSSSWYHSARIEREEVKTEECKAEKKEECKEEKKEEFCTPPSSSWYHSARIECEEVKTEECKEEKKDEFCTPPSSSWYHSARIEREEEKTEERKEEKKEECKEEKKEERKEEKKEECKEEKKEECKEEKKEECKEEKKEERKEEKKEEFCTPPSSSWYHSARIERKMEKRDEFCTELESEFEDSEVHWSQVDPAVSQTEHLGKRNREYFELLKRREYVREGDGMVTKQHDEERPLNLFCEWDDRLVVGKKIAEGGQAEIYEAALDGLDSVVAKVFMGGRYLQDYGRQWPPALLHIFQDRDSRQRSPFSLIIGATLLKNKGLLDRFAVVMHKKWGDLRSLIDLRMIQNRNQGPPFTTDQLLMTMFGIARDMMTLHNESPPILHRDLKASNILVQGSLLPSLDGGFEVTVSDYECSVGVVGTAHWRAPEIHQQLRDRVPMPDLLFTDKCDTYSYGMTCYELVTGLIPFEDHPSYQVRDLILKGERPELPMGLDPLVKKIITTCWNPIPSERPSFHEIVENLQDYMEIRASLSKDGSDLG